MRFVAGAAGGRARHFRKWPAPSRQTKKTASQHAALVAFSHAFLLEEGFRLDQPQGQQAFLPADWTSSDGAFLIKYRHSQSSMHFTVRGLAIESRLILHAIAVEDDKVFSVELKLTDFVNGGVPLTNFAHLFKEGPALVQQLRSGLAAKLVPMLHKPEYQAEAAPVAAPSRPSQHQQPTQQQQPQRPMRPMRPEPEFDPDPLRVPTRGGYRPSYPGAPPFGVGNSDLFPTGGFGVPDLGGGMLMGPRHPGFIGGGFGGPAPRLPPGVPPGARYDPPGIPGVAPFGPGRREPDPDHLPLQRPPPEDMYW
eukprot:TRINITY_DN881_c0_g1_i2.p1 TRINITY_DN881_c0_g1~~TRINITY_DN881_c0_g1_i2.p1  ORF type:complete len:308 (+),score=36.53 TRINITY_DN881_c0_g1_i2:764-1687(+)